MVHVRSSSIIERTELHRKLPAGPVAFFDREEGRRNLWKATIRKRFQLADNSRQSPPSMGDTQPLEEKK
jgi:hypothetical protein